MAANGLPSNADSNAADFSFFNLVPLRHQRGGRCRRAGFQLKEDCDIIPFGNDLLHFQPHHDLQQLGQRGNVLSGAL
jgi:hypothetical protein